MSETKHTPGWEISPVRYNRDFATWQNIQVAGDNMAGVTGSRPGFVCCVHAEDMDKARLIAAAPDLLEEAKAVVSFLERSGFTTEFLDGLRAAISKAEETP